MLRWINNTLNKNPTVLPPRHHPTNKTSNFETRNIAGEILELQFQCQSETSSPELISELTALYTQAVGHYESINDRRYLLYQRRLEHFLKKQNIEQVLMGKSAPLASKKDTTAKQIISARIKSRGEVAQIIERSEKLSKIYKTKIQNNLNEQQHQLSRRILKRRTMSNWSGRTKDEDDGDDNEIATIRDNEIATINIREFIIGDLIENKDYKGKKVFI